MATEIKKYLDTTALQTLVEQIKAEDAKVLQGAKDYADGLADNYDASGSAASAQAAAEAKAAELVAAEAAIARAAEQANAAAASAADGKAVAAQNAVDTLAGKVGDVPAGSTVMGIITNIQENAYDDTELRGLITALDSAKAEKTQVATDIASAKSELEGKIALKADQTALEAVSGVANAAVKQSDYNTKVAALEAEDARIAGLVSAEETARTEADAELEAAIKAIADDYLVEADKTALQEQITTNANAIKTLTDGVDAEKVDGVRDLIAYVEEHGPEVTGMKEDIAENAGKISTLEGKMSTAEGKISALEQASATHATTAALESAVEALEGVDAGFETRIAAVEAKFGDGEGNVEAQIEAAKQAAIADAVAQAEAKDVTRIAEAKKYTDDEIAELDLANTYAPKTHGHEMSEVTGLVDALAGKQAVGDYATKAEAQGYADAKDSAIAEAKKAGTDAAAALEAYKTSNNERVATVEGAVATKAEQSALTAAVERIAANETAIAANTSAINSFVAITSAEVEALFA